MDAKMRLVSLTRLQRCGGKNLLGIRIPFRGGAGLILRALVPAELAAKSRVCKFAGTESNPTLTPPIWHCFGAIPRPDKFVAVFYTDALLRMPIFMPRDQTLARVIPAAHGIGANILPDQRNRVEGAALYASLKPYQQGRLPWPFR